MQHYPHYSPPLEEPDEKYPFWLTTGRVVYHWHTRTKTGRSRELQEAAPDAFIELSVNDAERLDVVDGDMLEVASRRGSVRAPARVGGILNGHIFILFYYGYWDETDGHTRAANELTLSAWVPAVNSLTTSTPPFRFTRLEKGHSLKNWRT